MWHDKLVVFGSYEQEHPDLGPDFRDPGHSGQAGLRYVHMLPRVSSPGGIGFTQDLRIGFDFKSTNNRLEFGGTQVFASMVEIDQFPRINDATQIDRYSQIQLAYQLVYGQGKLTVANNTAAFEVAVPRSSAASLYDRVELPRSTLLPERFI